MRAEGIPALEVSHQHQGSGGGATQPKESSRWKELHPFTGRKGLDGTGVSAGTGGGQEQVKVTDLQVKAPAQVLSGLASIHSPSLTEVWK